LSLNFRGGRQKACANAEDLFDGGRAGVGVRRLLASNRMQADCRARQRVGGLGDVHGADASRFLIDIGVWQRSCSPLEVDGTTRHIAHAGNDDSFFLRANAGVIPIEQDGRQSVLKPGDMALRDQLL